MKYIKQLSCYDLFWILLVGDTIYFKDIYSPKLIWREIIHKLSSKTPHKIQQPLLNTPFDELSVNKYLNSY